MRLTEIFRLVWLNLASNKFKVILTSTGIIVGSATIMLVIAIGTGGREEVAEQFKNLNAGAIDITYEYQGNDFGGGMPGGLFGGEAEGMAAGGGMPEGMEMPEAGCRKEWRCRTRRKSPETAGRQKRAEKRKPGRSRSERT